MMEAATPATAAPGGGGGGDDANNSADKKVLTDLQTLSEQIDLCVEMLRQQNIPPGRPVDQATSDEALLGVVGFLEACAPRMVDLVEAAAQGALLEGTLMKCLEVNDRLLKVLSDCDGKSGEGGSAGGEGAGGGAATAPPAAAAKANSDLDLDDLLLDDTPSSPEAGGGYKQSTKLGAGRFDAASTGAAKGGDPFGASTDLLVPTPADGGGKKPAAASASDFTIDDGDDAGDGGGKKDGEDDDFDAFFKERTS